MTTIGIRDGIMAAGTLCVPARPRRASKKLHRVKGKVIGIAGQWQDGLTFVRWVEAGMDMGNLPDFITYGSQSDLPDFNAIVAHDDGTLEQWTEHFQPMPILDEFFSIGSGSHAATAAMHMGASAKRAVQIAMLVDPSTGGDIQIEKVG